MQTDASTTAALDAKIFPLLFSQENSALINDAIDFVVRANQGEMARLQTYALNFPSDYLNSANTPAAQETLLHLKMIFAAANKMQEAFQKKDFYGLFELQNEANSQEASIGNILVRAAKNYAKNCGQVRVETEELQTIIQQYQNPKLKHNSPDDTAPNKLTVHMHSTIRNARIIKNVINKIDQEIQGLEDSWITIIARWFYGDKNVADASIIHLQELKQNILDAQNDLAEGEKNLTEIINAWEDKEVQENMKTHRAFSIFSAPTDREKFVETLKTSVKAAEESAPKASK